ncbi:hypothetical protein NIA69_16870 [Gemmiger formicilis]|nr:hypothetical protein [Gemmiger formicilis]
MPLWYGTGHAIVDKKLGPIAEYRFEKGTVYFGKDFGSGPIAEYVYIGDTGEQIDYGRIPKGSACRNSTMRLRPCAQGSILSALYSARFLIWRR